MILLTRYKSDSAEPTPTGYHPSIILIKWFLIPIDIDYYYYL